MYVIRTSDWGMGVSSDAEFDCHYYDPAVIGPPKKTKTIITVENYSRPVAYGLMHVNGGKDGYVLSSYETVLAELEVMSCWIDEDVSSPVFNTAEDAKEWFDMVMGIVHDWVKLADL